MHEAEKLSLAQIQAFLLSSKGIRFAGEKPQQVYRWMERVLSHHRYHQQDRRARGLVRRYLEKMTGLSRAQVTRLIGRYAKRGKIEALPYPRHRFPQRYTRADLELLATVDEAHENLSGPATRRILEREYRQCGKVEYQRLASLSVSHLYHLRKQPRYRERRLHYVKTRPTSVALGERRRPDPQGQPGYLQVDTVLQGDPPGGQGVFHIKAVDEVTQGEIVASTPRIRQVWLEPVLAATIRQFPFRILGFHSDNGSEFINTIVARLLGKLLIEQTKSRPRRSNDNGLVETKNGAVIRKHLGYGSIDAAHAQLQQNFSIAVLQRIAAVRSDTQDAQLMQQAKRKRLEQFPQAASAVEMTVEENPQPQNRGFSPSLESAKNQSALSPFPPPRLLLHSLKIQTRKGAFLRHLPQLLQAHPSIGKDYRQCTRGDGGQNRRCPL